jgi:hypothetical protein
MKLIVLLFMCVATSFCSCNSFNYGLTGDKASDSYNLVGNKKSFGYKRVKYNMRHHRYGALGQFLKSRGKPDFIYEYKDGRRNSINLFYLEVDSVYAFKEMKANRAGSSVSVQCRNILPAERQSFDSLNLVSSK